MFILKKICVEELHNFKSVCARVCVCQVCNCSYKSWLLLCTQFTYTCCFLGQWFKQAYFAIGLEVYLMKRRLISSHQVVPNAVPVRVRCHNRTSISSPHTPSHPKYALDSCPESGLGRKKKFHFIQGSPFCQHYCIIGYSPLRIRCRVSCISESGFHFFS